jgi:hypothetical protein
MHSHTVVHCMHCFETQVAALMMALMAQENSWAGEAVLASMIVIIAAWYYGVGNMIAKVYISSTLTYHNKCLAVVLLCVIAVVKRVNCCLVYM